MSGAPIAPVETQREEVVTYLQAIADRLTVDTIEASAKAIRSGRWDHYVTRVGIWDVDHVADLILITTELERG